MPESLDVPIDALQLRHWSGTLLQGDDGAWRVEALLRVEPMSDGAPIAGTDRALLDNLGLRSEYRTTLAYPAGDAPATAQVGADMLTWVGTTHATLVSEWVGKTATAFVAAGE